MTDPLLRTIVVWLPDWPIVAARRTIDAPVDQPVALILRGLVFACSSEARQAGIRRGLAVREAQLRCPELWVAPYDPGADARAFEPVVAVVESIVPGVRILRPGLCAMRARGASRFYGGETNAAMTLLSGLESAGITARIGIADSVFAGEQSAQQTTPAHAVHIVEPGATRAFLAPLPVDVLDDANLVPVLKRLGLNRLADLAALERSAVGGRFAEAGLVAHARASGTDRLGGAEHAPPPDFDVRMAFEPPIDRVDQVAFGVRAAADSMIDRLAKARLVSTAIRITVDSEDGSRVEREWSHPHHFSASDVIDRVRWQLQGAGANTVGLAAPITRVIVSPTRVDSTAHHEAGLWGTSEDERIHHALSRLHSQLGHGSVTTPTIAGGRFLDERRVRIAWGDDSVLPGHRRASLPWPGSIPAPAPATVFSVARPAAVADEQGRTVRIDERGALSASPRSLAIDGARANAIEGWSGPWPVSQRWWDREASRRVDRFQMVDADGSAWLLVLENDEWSAEARYD
ncbi:DNA polymerase Y family protein [Agreia sp. COWG]|uniref:DNA polymerase Y family protein n=1 Tax=Agreia sp. COWG TaxID=2773266 RepID=UPI001927CBB8|nr:DNA polymerase Y family protein [Agreia sp. COWG]CAD6003060.1 UmuC domain-containing protein [Agreia sp. COWG]